jgi:hypothetical protein
LNLAVRVKQDPDLAMSLVDKILNAPKAARFFRNDAVEWKRAVVRWKADAKLKKGDELNQARRLIKEARNQALYPTSQAYYVMYLRASGMLHNYLRGETTAKTEAEAFSLLGQSYAALREPDGPGLDDYYYKACIFRLPHSGQAMECYARYEENQFLSSFDDRRPISASRLDYLKYLENLASTEAKR